MTELRIDPLAAYYPTTHNKILMTTRINTIDDVYATAADHRSIATHSFKRVSWAAVMKASKDTASQVDKEAIVNVVMNRAGVFKGEATRRVDAWMTTYQQTAAKAAQVKAQALQQAKEAADATVKATSRAAFGGFIALLLGALAAGWGGAVGRPRAVVTSS